MAKKKTEAKKVAPKTVKQRTAVDSVASGASIEFGAWVRLTKARSDKAVAGVDTLISALKTDKKINETSKLINVRKRYDGPAFDIVAARYTNYLKRQSRTPRKAA